MEAKITVQAKCNWYSTPERAQTTTVPGPTVPAANIDQYNSDMVSLTHSHAMAANASEVTHEGELIGLESKVTLVTELVQLFIAKELFLPSIVLALRIWKETCLSNILIFVYIYIFIHLFIYLFPSFQVPCD